MTAVAGDWESELQALAAREGTLKPERVVEVARDPDNVLHHHFEWDDDEAAAAYRILQAGSLIRRARVTITTAHGEPLNVRAFVSLEADRGGAGYRTVEAVLAKESLTTEMLSGALRELAAFRRKYQVLSEVAGVISAIDQLLSAPAERADAALRSAVGFAAQLERSNGLDRVSAARRAAAAFHVPANDVLVEMRGAG